MVWLARSRRCAAGRRGCFRSVLKLLSPPDDYVQHLPGWIFVQIAHTSAPFLSIFSSPLSNVDANKIKQWFYIERLANTASYLKRFNGSALGIYGANTAFYFIFQYVTHSVAVRHMVGHFPTNMNQHVTDTENLARPTLNISNGHKLKKPCLTVRHGSCYMNPLN